MAEELQHLLETIQKDGVAKAQAQADEILANAKDKAKEIVHKAGQEAETIRNQAKQEAEEFESRGKKALAQACRDLLISLGSDIETLMKKLVLESVGTALTVDALKEMLVKIADTYYQHNVKMSEGDLELTFSQSDLDALLEFVKSKLRDKVKQEVKLHCNNTFEKGFRLSYKDQDLYFDFTQEALAEALSGFLRPALREVVRSVIEQRENQ